MRRILLLLVLLSAALPARAQPDAAGQQRLLAARIDAAMGAGLLEIAQFRTMGGAPDPETGGRIAYVALRLRLQRDHDFGAWEGGTLQALAAALGAGPRGINGAARGGNRAGDELRANGSLRLRQDGEAWVPAAAPVAYAPARQEGPGSGAERLLGAIQTALTGAPRASGVPAAQVIEEELTAAWRNIEGRLARIERGFALAGGAPGSEYARIAGALAAQPGRDIRVLATTGSVQNIALLRDGTAQFGIVQADVAAAARRAMPSLRALASLYPEAVHVTVPASSPVRRMADLAGQRIGVGVPGSGARVTADAVLAAHGMQGAETVPLVPDAAAEALRSGAVAAVIGVSLAPSEAGLRIADALPIRLLPLEEAAIARLAGEETGLIRFAIPANLYPGQVAPVPTVATPALLLTTEALTVTEARRALDRLFRNEAFVRNGGPAALEVAIATGRTGLTVPLHPGAILWFQEARR